MPARLPAVANARPRAWLVLLLLAVANACQMPFTNPPPAGHSVPPTGLQKADQEFFSGRYDAAERDYASLSAAGVRHSQAHYALLLAYENRFREALAQGEAAVTANGDSASLARLTRVYDWSNDLPLALATGKRAVNTSPVDPLAHVFYAEALADEGRFSDASTQLQIASHSAGDAYYRSEIEREWANYYRDGGNVPAERQHFEKSRALMPSFPERNLELARFYYSPDGHAAEKARAIATQVLRSNAHDYGVAVAVGLVALLGPDYDTAIADFNAALRVQPNGAGGTLGLAEIQVSQKRDFKTAHDELQAALRAHPDSIDLYLYLRFLDQLVLNRDPGRDIAGATSAAADRVLATERRQALQRVNSYRASVGLPKVGEDSALSQGAEAHAYYFLFNYGAASEGGLGIHTEDPKLPGFTGVNGLLRGRHFGYQGLRGSEVINHVFSPHAAIQVWVDSVYHRYPILSPETTVAGYGEAELGPLAIQVMDMGLSDPTSAPPVVYPYPNQQDVPTSFLGNELPNPLPTGVNQPVGYPVTLELGSADQLLVDQARLLDAGGNAVPSYVLKPGTASQDSSECSLLAKNPLQPGSRYTVIVSGALNGSPFSKRWSFRVEGAQGTIQ